MVDSFEKMGLPEDLLRGVYGMGYQNPSAIQQRAIVPILKKRDVIAQAQSGTGKSTLICISGLASVDTTALEPQVLYLSPTRELATQTQKTCLALGEHMNIQAHA